MQTHVLGRMETWVAMLEVVSVAAVAAAREALAVRAVTEPLGVTAASVSNPTSRVMLLTTAVGVGVVRLLAGAWGMVREDWAEEGRGGRGAQWAHRAQPTLGEGVVGMAGRVTLGETMVQLYLAAPASSSSATRTKVQAAPAPSRRHARRVST